MISKGKNTASGMGPEPKTKDTLWRVFRFGGDTQI